jgi:hypothetical protein
MPRRLVAFVLAIVLSCYGFAALAQNVAGGVHSQEQCSLMQANEADSALSELASLLDQAVALDLGDAGDEPPSHGDTGSDHAEAVDYGYRAAGPFPLSESPPKPALTPAPSAILARHERPPRGGAFAA